MSIKRTILLATASIAIGLALSPVQAQTVNNPGPTGAGDDGVGLPLPTPPDWLSKPRPKSSSELNFPARDCASIRTELARLWFQLATFERNAQSALTNSAQEEKLALAAHDTWQKETALRKSTWDAAEETQNPTDKAILQKASAQHSRNVSQARERYQSHIQKFQELLDDYRFYLGQASITEQDIERLKNEEKEACAQNKIAGGGAGNGMQLGGPDFEGGLHFPLGDDLNKYNTNPPVKGSGNEGAGYGNHLGGNNGDGLHFPLGDDLNKYDPKPPVKTSGNGDNKPDATPKTPVIKQETQKKVSALPNGFGNPALPFGNQRQNAGAPNFRAYFASQTQAASGFLSAARARMQNSDVQKSVLNANLQAPVGPAASTVTPPPSQIVANPSMPAMPAGTMPVRVEQPCPPATAQAVPQNPTVAISPPVNGLAVSNIGSRVGRITLRGH